MMTRFPRALFLLVLLAVSAGAQAPDSSISFLVTPDHADWLYRRGDSARVRISLLKSVQPLAGARVRVDIGPERMPLLRRDTLDISSGAINVSVSAARPGFLRVTAVANVNGATYTQMATVGFDPEKITATTTMPGDFEQFWRTAIAEGRKIPMLPQMTRLAERSTPDVDVYHISFQNYRVGSKIYGMLSVPTKPGKYPAMLVVPGAGVRPYFPDVKTAAKGVIHLAIGIHGIPVDRDSLLYNELRATALQAYYTYNADDRDAYYYKRVFVGVIRAADFLLGLPQWDGSNFVVQGGSQGGALTLLAGALDPRVKAVAVTHPAMSDQFGYFAGHAGGWPHILQDTLHLKSLAEKKETLRYYDGVNFARLLKVPGIYAWGYNDNTVPPTSSWATYNAVTAPKEKIIVPETGHVRVPAESVPMDAFLLRALGVKP